MTGIVDAVSYLALGSVFSAIQTGNVVLLGFGLGGWLESEGVGPGDIADELFRGAFVGGVVAAAGRAPSRSMTAAIGAEAVLIGVAACSPRSSRSTRRRSRVPGDRPASARDGDPHHHRRRPRLFRPQHHARTPSGWPASPVTSTGCRGSGAGSLRRAATVVVMLRRRSSAPCSSRRTSRSRSPPRPASVLATLLVSSAGRASAIDLTAAGWT